MARRSRCELNYRLVVFDLDGTLVDSGADLAASVNFSLRALDLQERPASEIYGFIGHGARQLVAGSIRAALPAAREPLVDQALECFQEHYGLHCLEETRLFAGIEDLLLDRARAGQRLAVLTNKPRAVTESILEGLGVRGLFADVVGGDDLATRKPDPAGLLSLCASALSPPRDTVVLVGDSTVDADTARRAGVDFWGVSWGFGEERELRAAGASRVFSAASEVALACEGRR